MVVETTSGCALRESYYHEEHSYVNIALIPPKGSEKLFITVKSKLSQYLHIQSQASQNIDSGFYEIDIAKFQSLDLMPVFNIKVNVNSVINQYDLITFNAFALVEGCLTNPIEYQVRLSEENGIPLIWREKVGEVNNWLEEDMGSK